jgi:hypothetical protein
MQLERCKKKCGKLVMSGSDQLLVYTADADVSAEHINVTTQIKGGFEMQIKGGFEVPVRGKGV